MLRRTSTLLGLHRFLLIWPDHKKDTLLIDALRPLAVLEAYVSATDQPLAPELRLAKLYGAFHKEFQQPHSLISALTSIDVQELQSVRAARKALWNGLWRSCPTGR